MNIEYEKPNLTHTLCFLLSGHAGVGKTYCAEYLSTLAKKYELKLYAAHFANQVKATARFMDWDGKKDRAGRILLQRIGQVGREYDPLLWARLEFHSIDSQVGFPFEVVTIDDWRFVNELVYVKENEPLYKPITIRVVAPEREVLKGTPEYNDISETELDNFEFDYVVYNPPIEGNWAISTQLERIFLLEIQKYNRV
jgi:hypothetical protein